MILLAVAMVGLLAIVGLALDGGMLYWNQRRAQNGADAAALAGTSVLANQVMAEEYDCVNEPVSDALILARVYEYAANNEVPGAETGQNVEAFYLTEDASGRRVDLINPSTGQPWRVGETGTIPCVGTDIVGLRVRASFPQDTFLAGVVGIVETNVTVEASAIYEFRNWCTDFVIYALNTDRNKDVLAVVGAGNSVTKGGIHSNGGLHLGGGGQGIYLEPGYPVEYDTNGDSQIGYDKITGGPDPSAPDLGIEQVPNRPLPDDFFYDFEDFAPGGFIWNEVSSTQRFYFTGDIGTNDVKEPGGALKDGLYVTEGSINLSRLSNLEEGDKPWVATLVARGSVQVSGGINVLPMAYGVFIFSLSDNTADGAVNLSGSNNTWAGMIYAPNGLVSFSSARNSNLTGQIVGFEVDASGSNNQFNYRPGYCPANPPRVLLIE